MLVVAPKSYIETRNGGYYIAGTRISLDSVVYAYRDGRSPEDILDSFPLLTLEQIYGAIAFYHCFLSTFLLLRGHTILDLEIGLHFLRFGKEIFPKIPAIKIPNIE